MNKQSGAHLCYGASDLEVLVGALPLFILGPREDSLLGVQVHHSVLAERRPDVRDQRLRKKTWGRKFQEAGKVATLVGFQCGGLMLGYLE